MKAKELMFGDFIKLPDGANAKVISIAQDGVYFEDSQSEGVASFDNLSPIPLTPEILEKNGFQKKFNYQWKYCDNGCKIVISIAPQIEIEGEILGEPPVNIMLEGALFDIDITSDCYVHTLQHALRLCGIEKEIVL